MVWMGRRADILRHVRLCYRAQRRRGRCWRVSAPARAAARARRLDLRQSNRRGLAIAFFATGVCQILHEANAQAWTPTAFLYPWLPVALFALAVAAIARAEALQSVLGRALPARTLALLGLATYPLYLLHQTIGSALIAALAGRGVPAGTAVWAAAAGMISLALLVTRWLEPLLRRWMAERVIPPRVPPPD